MDTIYALTTGSYRAGVAIIRVSGPAAIECFRRLSLKSHFTPRHAAIHTLTDPASGHLLDFRSLVTVFPAPNSFTGEDTVEFNLHGGRAIIEGVLKALSHLPGCRLAEPGEFTKRAFQNGKIDLTEAEAIADIIDAETEAQKLQALDQVAGSLRILYQGWSEKLSGLLAHQEADIEFPEDDLPQGISATLEPEVKILLQEITAHLNDGRRGERLRQGIRIAIFGAPNAGKSSLLNALAQRDAAIVSEEAGTTRDIIEVHLDLGGYPVILADTAGLRETTNKIEAEGIRRAAAHVQEADLKIALFDGTAAEDAETKKLVDANTIIAYTKLDLLGADVKPREALNISATTGQGIDQLLKILGDKTAAAFKSKSGPPLTRARHRSALEEASAALTRCISAPLPELAAEDLRLALRALGAITGRVHVEELLDKIFRDFCIGK